jgi:hypothetical protein
MDLFRQIAVLNASAQLSDASLLEIAMKQHSRMVFAPTPKELEWVFSVSHRENFGVFEESSFANPSRKMRVRDKLAFTWRVLRRKGPLELGFWPWLSIRAFGLPGLSSAYWMFRKLQSR